ncbi:MAG: hypothetical protein ACKO7N_04415 [Candidatus Nitrosotenuis sp.]
MTKDIIHPKWINEFTAYKVIVLNPEDVLHVFQYEFNRNPTREEFEICFHLSKKYLEKNMNNFWECVELAVKESKA